MSDQTLISLNISLYKLQYEDSHRYDEIMAEAQDHDEDNNE